MGNRLKDLREARNWTHDEIASSMGMSRSGYIKIERGERRLTDHYIQAAARVFEVTPSEIIGDDPPPKTRMVTVAAHVQAGYWAETWEWTDDEKYDVAVPDDPNLRMVTLYGAETRGPSMNRRYPEGTAIVFTNVQETEESPQPGKRYVVQRMRADGQQEHTVKLLHRDDDGKFWLLPESTDPLFQAAISVEDGVEDGDAVTIIGRVRFAVTRE